MKFLYCAFCDSEVTLPVGWNNKTAKAICKQCYERGGRLPNCPGGKGYEFRVDPNGRIVGRWWPGRAKWKQSKIWTYSRKTYFSNPVSATFFTCLMAPILFAPIISLILWPIQFLLTTLIVVIIWCFWRYAMRRRWLD